MPTFDVNIPSQTLQQVVTEDRKISSIIFAESPDGNKLFAVSNDDAQLAATDGATKVTSVIVSPDDIQINVTAGASTSSLHINPSDINFTTDSLTLNGDEIATENYVNAAVSGLESQANKSTSIVTDQASDIKYPSVKSVYDWANPQFNSIISGNVSFKRIPGFWYSSALTDFVGSTASLTRNIIRLTSFVVSQTEPFDRIAMEISGAGTAGSLVLLGIYESDSNGSPTNPILTAGTIMGDSATNQSIVINQQLTPGIYWLSYIHNSVASISFRTIQATTGAMPGILGLVSGSFGGNQLNLIQMSHTYDGTFPSISGATYTGLNVAIVALRRA